MENFNIFNKVEEIKKEYALGDSEEICYLLNGKKYDEEYLPTLYSIDIVGGKLIVNYDDEDYSDMEINEAGRLIAKYVDKETQKIVTKDLGQVVPNFSVGNTTTGEAGTSANVSMTGTITEPVLNFTIPKGEDFDGNITNDLTIKKDSPSIILENSDSTNIIKITGTSTGFNISTPDSNVYEYNGDHIFSKNIYINKTKPEFILQNDLNSFSLLWDKLDDASSVLYFKDFTNSENLASIQQSIKQLNVYGNIQSLTDNNYGTLYAGNKVKMVSDVEGGNISFYSKNNVNKWEIDSYNDTAARLYASSVNNSSILTTFSFTDDGNLITGNGINLDNLRSNMNAVGNNMNSYEYKTNLLDIDSTNPIADKNLVHRVATSNAANLQNSPITTGSFYGKWELIYLVQTNILVQITEFIPTQGRLWFNRWNGTKWTGWVSNT